MRSVNRRNFGASWVTLSIRRFRPAGSAAKFSRPKCSTNLTFPFPQSPPPPPPRSRPLVFPLPLLQFDKFE